ncbi:RNA polymerase sigma factor [Urechidicola vernalis]|uniref:Sigma-70 family RNA polymerase sigma factor n=1 Tax=Urechidicola vernalis TaxID=3075600 RepID=A0ABU2Y369_9FLAO|nr:sigma-70 family RNA polymerase sigma factor [Urechidicola sp. P050]MDT0552653.1 sigma-70 family RNA polymerase sigma factor [Urechidicola sp. P050]
MAKSMFDNICEERLFANLFDKYSKSLHDFLYYKFGSHLNPEDKVQEAFIKLWDNCGKVSADKAKSFLFTVASNSVLNDIKHNKVVLNYQKLKPKDYTNETPEFIMEEEEYMQKYQNALAKLTEGQREAFLLNRIEGKRHKEIAELLGISVKGVEKRLYGALKSLRKEIEGI